MGSRFGDQGGSGFGVNKAIATLQWRIEWNTQ